MVCRILFSESAAIIIVRDLNIFQMTNNTDVNIKVFTCVFVLDEENDRILLGYKKRGLLEKKWNGFGGKVEPGETILAAAERYSSF